MASGEFNPLQEIGSHAKAVIALGAVGLIATVVGRGIRALKGTTPPVNIEGAWREIIFNYPPEV